MPLIMPSSRKAAVEAEDDGADAGDDSLLLDVDGMICSPVRMSKTGSSSSSCRRLLLTTTTTAAAGCS